MADDCKKAEWRLRKETSNLDIPDGTFEEEESIREYGNPLLHPRR